MEVGGGCREGKWGRRDWTEKERGKREKVRWGIFFIICGPHINTSYVATGGKKFNRVAAT